MSHGFFVLPCRLMLPSEQRERLERLCRARGMDISDVASEIVLAYLDELPDSDLAEPRPADVGPTLHEQLRQHQRELRRLRNSQQQLGPAAPAWLANYINDIEREIASLWQQTRDSGEAG